MKEYNVPDKATCRKCLDFGGQCPHRGGAICPRYRRNDRLAGLLVSIASIVIVIAISILCNYAGK